MEDIKQEEKRMDLLLTRTILSHDINNRITALKIHPKVIEIELDSKETHFIIMQEVDDLIKAVTNLLKQLK